MSTTYYKYAQFESCTPLSAAATNYTFDLTWTLEQTNIYKYYKIEIYRYIGEYNVPVTTAPDENNIHTASLPIYTIEQQFDTDDEPINSVVVTTDYFNGSVESSTQTGLITDFATFSDDLNRYNNNDTVLVNNHNLTDASSDSTLLTDIVQTKRMVYYIITTWIKGVYDASPYCIGSHCKTGVLDNTSTKTQVKHDVLHFEGDLIWVTKIPNSLVSLNSDSRGISRTSVDLNSLYLNPAQHTQRGGYAWTSDRGTGNFFRFNLKNGLQTGKFNNIYQYDSPGHGICVEPSTGDCYSGDDPTGHIVKGLTSSLPVSCDESTSGSTTDICDLTYCYGIVNIPQQDTKYCVSERNHANDTGYLTIFNVLDCSKTSLTTPKIYGVASGPDGSVFGVSSKYNTIAVIKSDNTTGLDTSINSYNVTVTTDNPALWPNNGDKKYYHLICCREDGWICDHYINTNQNADSVIDDSKSINSEVNYEIDGETRTSKGVGIDGENNIWGLGLYRNKIYRIGTTSDYSSGGNCRYPSNNLENQPLSYNNSEIEWFLLRDAGYVNTSPASTILGNVDDTYSADWLGNGTLATAHDAWWSLVENKRFEINPNSYKADASTNPSGGFNVTKETGGTSTYTKHYGIRMKDYTTNLAGCLTGIEAWYNTFANIDSQTCYLSSGLTLTQKETLVENNLKGRRLFPWYGTKDSCINLAFSGNNARSYLNSYKPGYAIGDTTTPSYTLELENWNGYSYEYSDFTGNLLIAGLENSKINKDIINPNPNFPTEPDPENPTVIQPTVSMNLTAQHSNNGYQDVYAYCYPWDIVSTTLTHISGYDNLTLTGTISVNSGSFDIQDIHFYTDDYDSKRYVIENNGEIRDVFPINHTYNEPTKIGLFYLPSGHNDGSEYLHIRKAGGSYFPYFTLSTYNVYTGVTTLYTLSATVTVLERWPEPKAYLESTDLLNLRTSMFNNSTWGVDRFDKSSSLYNEGNTNDALRNNIIYGVDPIKIDFQDRSIARTYPISSWYVTLSTNNNLISWYPTSSLFLQTTTALNVGADEQNFFDALTSLNFRYGDYKFIMNVAASTTNTSSDKEFINYMNISEFEPFAQFWAKTAYTVNSNYTSDSPTPAIQIANILNGNNINYPFISGYAPNLTIYFQDSSEAHTFPIAEYIWNFGDYYNEGSSNVKELSSNYYTISSDDVVISQGTFDVPNWKTNYTGHTAVHTYTIPGTYDVSLTVKASSTNTQDVCAKYVDTINDVKRFYIYVEEIPPVYTGGIKISDNAVSGFTYSGVFSGISPQTYYFVASNILAGSFPICKVMWDFGDGTIETITRIPSSDITSQGLTMTYNIDPRYTIVPHTYINNTTNNNYYNISVSAFACNTNTAILTSSNTSIGPIFSPYIQADEKRKLIGSRFDSSGNIIYLFEGLTTKNIYTVAISGVI
jgi:hypothetical protein